MKNLILSNLDNASVLEQLYRSNKSEFKKQIDALRYENHESILLQAWHERLNYNDNKISLGSTNEVWIVGLLILIAGLFANSINFTNINPEIFFERNTSLLILPSLMFYFAWKRQVNRHEIFGLIIVTILCAVFVNQLPHDPKSSSILLINLHLPIFLWSLLGYVYVGGEKNINQSVAFLKYNGDFLIMSSIILASCFLFTAITIGLFGLIGLQIEHFYSHYIAIWAISGIPMLATFLVQNNPQIINKISPIIAKVFTPLAFINLTIYIIAIFYTGKFPQQDRNMLLIFNILLIVVLALIFFSVAESSKNDLNRFTKYLLLGLCILTIVINAIVLNAILIRIIEWGFTPNRVAVLGSNILIFANLIVVTYQLIGVFRNKKELTAVDAVIVRYLPLYGIWAAFICFIMPWIFSLK